MCRRIAAGRRASRARTQLGPHCDRSCRHPGSQRAAAAGLRYAQEMGLCAFISWLAELSGSHLARACSLHAGRRASGERGNFYPYYVMEAGAVGLADRAARLRGRRGTSSGCCSTRRRSASAAATAWTASTRPASGRAPHPDRLEQILTKLYSLFSSSCMHAPACCCGRVGAPLPVPREAAGGVHRLQSRPRASDRPFPARGSGPSAGAARRRGALPARAARGRQRRGAPAVSQGPVAADAGLRASAAAGRPRSCGALARRGAGARIPSCCTRRALQASAEQSVLPELLRFMPASAWGPGRCSATPPQD
jgi:hypothetical protein